jgi:hypothetical protein
LLLLLALIVFFSCNDDQFNNADNTQLTFSVDTLLFDTVFTSLGSSTLSFKAYNPSNQTIKVSSIKLARSGDSPYRLNIDGEMTNEAKDVTIAPHDSIFIFVEVTIDPNGQNQPMIVQDSVLFSIGKNEQDVDLISWGQDFVPINGEVLTTTTWTADKPYLIYNGAMIDSGQVLTIEPGARIHFHKNSFFIGAGAIKAIGTKEKPITFEGDRLEDMYFDIPDQWYGMVIYPNEEPTIFENVNIYNAFRALQIGIIEVDGAANVKLHNVKIEHSSDFGILAIKSVIDASNLVVAECGSYCLAIQAGGAYSFNHCTFANYWSGPNYPRRKNPSVAITNFLYDPSSKVQYIGNLYAADFTNSIIWGDAVSTEVGIYKHPDVSFNCSFDNSLVMVSDSLLKAEPDIFKTMRPSVNPKFFDTKNYKWDLDSASVARNAGLRKYAELVPLDINNVSRLTDEGPDLGAYERVDTVKTK